MIEEGSRVRIHYTLSVDGEIIESSVGQEPFEYIHGTGQIVPGLEEQLAGLEPGDKKEIDVPPEKGYGEFDRSAVQRVPRAAFRDPEELEVGDVVTGEIRGQRFQATVAEVGPEEITLDLNHPLAGKTLHFSIEVVSVG
ncbi:MAG: peptidyl-prolyl cis-trans isomerase [Candidatus Binatia bacterium]|nr:MAG: peptidyl-prolyl cis-trans isomerase [Candidatus Binatia bacterium]